MAVERYVRHLSLTENVKRFECCSPVHREGVSLRSLCVCAVSVNGALPKSHFRLVPLFVMWSAGMHTVSASYSNVCRVVYPPNLSLRSILRARLTSVAVACDSESVPFKSATRSRHSAKLFHFRATVFLVTHSNQQGVEKRKGKGRLLISQ